MNHCLTCSVVNEKLSTNHLEMFSVVNVSINHCSKASILNLDRVLKIVYIVFYNSSNCS